MGAEPRNRFLSDADAQRDGVVGRWSASNEQWWDWYMSLAVNETPVARLQPGPEIPPDVDPPLALVGAELDRELEVPDEAKARFREDGYVHLREVVSPAALIRLRRTFRELFADAKLPAMGFPSLELMWTRDPWCRAFVLSRKLASIAGQLLGVDAVRLYHDNALIKSPGCGRTPWHYDAHHYPIASENVVTVWLPLQATPLPMGPLAFARGIEAYRLVEDLDFDKFGTGYDAAVIGALERARVDIAPVEYDLGDATFHHTRSLHSAGPNRTDVDRMALATTYFEDGARLVDEVTMISGDYEKFMPGVGPGGVIASDLNPVIWRKAER